MFLRTTLRCNAEPRTAATTSNPKYPDWDFCGFPQSLQRDAKAYFKALSLKYATITSFHVPYN
jgi:hypothetical protein